MSAVPGLRAPRAKAQVRTANARKVRRENRSSSAAGSQLATAATYLSLLKEPQVPSLQCQQGAGADTDPVAQQAASLAGLCVLLERRPAQTLADLTAEPNRAQELLAPLLGSDDTEIRWRAGAVLASLPLTQDLKQRLMPELGSALEQVKQFRTDGHAEEEGSCSPVLLAPALRFVAHVCGGPDTGELALMVGESGVLDVLCALAAPQYKELHRVVTTALVKLTERDQSSRIRLCEVGGVEQFCSMLATALAEPETGLPVAANCSKLLVNCCTNSSACSAVVAARVPQLWFSVLLRMPLARQEGDEAFFLRTVCRCLCSTILRVPAIAKEFARQGTEEGQQSAEQHMNKVISKIGALLENTLTAAEAADLLAALLGDKTWWPCASDGPLTKALCSMAPSSAVATTALLLVCTASPLACLHVLESQDVLESFFVAVMDSSVPPPLRSGLLSCIGRVVEKCIGGPLVVSDIGGVELLWPLMRSSEPREVREAALATIRALVSTHPESRRSLYEEFTEALALVIGMATDPTDGCSAEALLTIAACELDQAGRTAVAKNGGARAIVAFLERCLASPSKSQEVLQSAQVALTALVWLSKTSDLAVGLCEVGAPQLASKIVQCWPESESRDVAALCAQLWDNIGSSDPSAKFWLHGELGPGSSLHQVKEFYVLSGTKPRNFQSLSTLRSAPFSVGSATAFLVSAEDKKLADLVSVVKARCEKLADLSDKVKEVARSASEAMGGPLGSDPECEDGTEVALLKRTLRSSVVPLGEVDHGGSLPRHLLFKFLADSLDIPAALDCRGSQPALSGISALRVTVDLQDSQGSRRVDLLRDPGTLA